MGQASTSPLVVSLCVREAYILILVTREAHVYQRERGREKGADRDSEGERHVVVYITRLARSSSEHESSRFEKYDTLQGRRVTLPAEDNRAQTFEKGRG